MVRTPAAEASPITVLVVDDHAVLRDGLVSLIEAEEGLCVVATAACAASALECAQAVRPEVAVVDLLIPGGGLRALGAIRGASPETKLLVLSVLDDAEHVRAAFSVGASGYFHKRRAARELLGAIREAHAGRRLLGVTPAMRRELSAPKRLVGAGSRGVESLGARELQILRMLARGHTHKEIALELGLSKKTVDTYRGRLQVKLNLRGRAELVRFAVSAGLFGEPE